MADSDEFKLVVRGGKRMQVVDMSDGPRNAHITAATDIAHTADAIKLVAPSATIMPTSSTGASVSRKHRRAQKKAGTEIAHDVVETRSRYIARDCDIIRATPFQAALTAALDAFYHRCRDTSAATSDVVVPLLICYGLGSLRFGTNSRIQLAALLNIRRILCAKWGVDESAIHTSAYDPLFDDEDVRTLRPFGVGITTDDISAAVTGGRPHPAPPVVFFMPHCNSDMYDKVLAQEALLPHACIVGNSFSWYARSWDLKPANTTETKATEAAGDKDAFLKRYARACQPAGAKAAGVCAEFPLPLATLEEEYLRALDCTRYVNAHV